MPEEKKSTNLKDRLKKTAVAPAPNPGAGGMGPPGGVAPSSPQGMAPPPGFADMPSPFGPGGIPGGMGGMSGIPGMGDVPPPQFVQQQQAAAAAQARARAAADDPFGSTSAQPMAPQEMRIVIDGGAVDDKEVGRGRAGTIFAIAAVGLIMGGAGYAAGQVMQTKSEERSTMASLQGVRTGVSTAGDAIGALKTNVDRAAEHANIPMGGQGEEAPAAPTHPPDVDEAFITFAQSQDPEHPPLSPDIYANRVGRLRAEIVQKLAQLQVQVDAAWHQLSIISRTNVANTRASLASVGGGNDWQRGVVTFARTPAGETLAQLVTAPAAPDATGHITLAGAGLQPPLQRMFYQTGPLTQDQLPTVAIRVMSNVGLAQQAQTAAGEQWLIYRGRLGELKVLVDAMSTTQQQLSDALRGGAGH